MRWALLALGVALVVGIGVYLFSESDEGESGDSPSAREVSEEDAPAPPSIRFIDQNVLKLIEPDGEATKLDEGVSAGSTASPTGEFLTWVAFSGDQPVVQLYSVKKGETRPVFGTDPKWRSDGSAFVVLQGAPGVKCDQSRCKGAVSVVQIDPGTTKRKLVLDEGPYSVRGWIGDRVVVSDERKKRVALVVGRDEQEELEIPGKEIASISPDGEWIVRKTDGGPLLVELDGLEVHDERSIAGADVTLTSITWRPDGKGFAAIANTLEGARLVTVGVGDAALKLVTELEPSGGLFWNETGDGLLFTAVDRDEVALKATFCPLGGGSCTTYVDWQSGSRVVGIAPAD